MGNYDEFAGLNNSTVIILGKNSASDLLHIIENTSGKMRVFSINFIEDEVDLPDNEIKKGMIAKTIKRTNKQIRTVPVVIIEGDAKNDLLKTEDKPIDTTNVPVDDKLKTTEIPTTPVNNDVTQNNTIFIPVIILA